MKRFNVIAFLAAMLFVGATQAQTVDEVINKHLDAIGGKEKLRTINSLRSEASVSVQGMEIPITMYQVHNKAMKQEYVVMNMAAFTLIRIDSGWTFMPFQGQTAPEPMTADALKMGREQLDIQSELLDYAAKGNKVELMGKEEMEGSEVYKIKLTKNTGTEQIQLIDAKSYYLVGSLSKLTVNGQEMDMKATYGNFQKLPEGIVMPFSMETSQLPAPLVFKKYEVNPVIPDSVFKIK